MAVLTSTGITFSDSTSLASAAPTVSQIGGIIMAYYAVTTPTVVTNNYYGLAYYATNTTVAGSSLAYDVRFTPPAQYSGTAVGTVAGAFVKTYPGAATSMTFPTSGSGIGSGYVAVIRNAGMNVGSPSNAVITYSTPSGSWRSLSPVQIQMINSGCGSEGNWEPIMWQRYA